MDTGRTRQCRSFATYNDGRVYRPARGRYAPRAVVEDHGGPIHPVVDLVQYDISADRFLRIIEREMKIRGYRSKTLKTYTGALRKFLNWFRYPLREVTVEDVRDYLELLVDGGLCSDSVGNALSALRTAFDKMCGRATTLGLVTPRRPRRIPTVLSPQEVDRLLQAAPSMRDKLLLGLMYATGMRVSEAVAIRWEDIDFDRNAICVRRGKGGKDRYVMLPKSYRPLLERFSALSHGQGYVFPGDRPKRHLSPRSAQRAMKRAVQLAGITKKATCHTMRHSFATSLIENGTDIRFIQEFRGHVRLETTRLYTRVARRTQQTIVSPLDRLTESKKSNAQNQPAAVGRMKIAVGPIQRDSQGIPAAQVDVTITNHRTSLFLPAIVIREPRPGWTALEVPPLEAWASSLRGLPRVQRERIESADFYQTLQQAATERYLYQKQTLRS
jgi:integrase/recombinase XerD